MKNIAFEYNGYKFYIMTIPERKKPCLMIDPPGENCFYKVASFNSEETAEWFIEHLKKMIG